jgi:hypothetical protein
LQQIVICKRWGDEEVNDGETERVSSNVTSIRCWDEEVDEVIEGAKERVWSNITSKGFKDKEVDERQRQKRKRILLLKKLRRLGWLRQMTLRSKNVRENLREYYWRRTLRLPSWGHQRERRLRSWTSL